MDLFSALTLIGGLSLFLFGMQGRPVTVRLLDPPLHEFLPTEDKDIAALAQEMNIPADELKATIRSMAKAKADIERIADTLVQGYKKQLDTLYQAEAVDIAGDVSVIENMMKRDGLTGGSDFGQVMGGH